MLSKVTYLYKKVQGCPRRLEAYHLGQHMKHLTNHSNDNHWHRKIYNALHNDYHNCPCARDPLGLPLVMCN